MKEENTSVSVNKDEFIKQLENINKEIKYASKAHFDSFNVRSEDEINKEDYESTKSYLGECLARKKDLIFGTHYYEVKILEKRLNTCYRAINYCHSLIAIIKWNREIKSINKQLESLREFNDNIMKNYTTEEVEMKMKM